MSADYRTRLLRAYDRSLYAGYGNGGVKALARAAGLHPNTVYDAMRGNHTPKAATREKLDAVLSADALDAEGER